MMGAKEFFVAFCKPGVPVFEDMQKYADYVTKELRRELEVTRILSSGLLRLAKQNEAVAAAYQKVALDAVNCQKTVYYAPAKVTEEQVRKWWYRRGGPVSYADAVTAITAFANTRCGVPFEPKAAQMPKTEPMKSDYERWADGEDIGYPI